MKEVGFKSRSNLAWCLRASALRRRFERFERLDETALDGGTRRLRKNAEGVLLYLGLQPREVLAETWGWWSAEGWETKHTSRLTELNQEIVNETIGYGT